MFVQINPNAESYSETLSTLKFAERVSGVELGAARSNKEGKDVRDLMEQVSSLKDIVQKDEEIEHLQQNKDFGIRSPRTTTDRYGTKLLKHSSSSPCLPSLVGATPHGQRFLGGRVMNLVISIQSLALNSQWKTLCIIRKYYTNQILVKEGTGSSHPADLELLGFGDAESEGRLSDISDDDLSMGTKTSVLAVSSLAYFPDAVKTSQSTPENM